MEKLDFAYDPYKDILTIEGIPYSGDLFRQYGFGPSGADRWHRIKERRPDGVLILETMPSDKIAETAMLDPTQPERRTKE